MTWTDLTLWTLAAAFALTTGANDGATLTALTQRTPGLSTPAALALLTTAVALTPHLLGTAVATTLLRGVIDPAPTAPHALATGCAAAIAITAALTARGAPTSLTLAVIGGITGAALGTGLTVHWTAVALVLTAGIAAPALGALLGFALTRLARRLPPLPHHALTRIGHTAAFIAQSTAYAANDAQKMLVLPALATASAAVATGSTAAGGHPASTGAAPAPWLTLLIAALFFIGAALGLPRVRSALGNGVLATRPGHTIAAETSAATAVLGTGLLGVPVSMTQSLTGALIGAGVNDGYRRLRWRAVGRMGTAWALTLPLSAALGTVLALTIDLAGSLRP